MNRIQTIRVGGEDHSVEGDSPDGTAQPVVGNLTEQCGTCGAGGQDSVYHLRADGLAYSCGGCGRVYPIRRSHPNDVVFP